MVAANHDRRLDLSFLYQLVHGQSELRAFAVAEPADARWQALVLDALARQVNPSGQDAILWKELQNQVVGRGDIGGIAGERHPAKRPSAFAKQRPNVSGNKTGKVVGIFDAALKGEGANIVAIVEGYAAHLLQTQHAFHVAGDR